MKYAVFLIFTIILAMPMAYASNTDILILTSKVHPPMGQPISFSGFASTNFPVLNTRESTASANIAVSGFSPQIKETNFDMNMFTSFPTLNLREVSFAFNAVLAGFGQQFSNNPSSINVQANVNPIMPQFSNNPISINAQANVQPIMPQVSNNPISINAQANVQPIMTQIRENQIAVNVQAGVNPINPQVLQPTQIPSIGFATNFPLNVGPGIQLSGNIPLREIPTAQICNSCEPAIRTVDLDRDFDFC